MIALILRNLICINIFVDYRNIMDNAQRYSRQPIILVHFNPHNFNDVTSFGVPL